MARTIMEKVNIQLTKENIQYIKSKSSFAKIVNLLLEEMITNPELEDKILLKIANLEER